MKPSRFSDIAHLFLELRGRGLSLSSQDLDFLCRWQRLGVEPRVISEVLWQMAEECEMEGRVFPPSLAPVARRVDALLKRQHEF